LEWALEHQAAKAADSGEIAHQNGVCRTGRGKRAGWDNCTSSVRHGLNCT
jgi:hypothetical protein